MECKHFLSSLLCWLVYQNPDKELSTKVRREYFSFLSKTATTCIWTRAYLQIAQAQKRKGREKTLQLQIFFSYHCKVSANFTQMQWKNLPAITLRFQLPLKKFTAIKLALRSCGNIYIKINYFVCPTYFGT